MIINSIYIIAITFISFSKRTIITINESYIAGVMI